MSSVRYSRQQWLSRVLWAWSVNYWIKNISTFLTTRHNSCLISVFLLQVWKNETNEITYKKKRDRICLCFLMIDLTYEVIVCMPRHCMKKHIFEANIWSSSRLLYGIISCLSHIVYSFLMSAVRHSLQRLSNSVALDIKDWTRGTVFSSVTVKNCVTRLTKIV